MATQAQITINAVAGSDDDLPLNTLVTLSNNGLGGETTYLWSILSQPEGPTDALSATTILSPTFTPTKEGSYLIRLIVNFGLPSEQTDLVIAAVRELETRERIPAAGETTENSPTTGWANTAVDRILQRVTRLEDAGVVVGAVGAAGLVAGNVLWVNDTTTIATGLPDQRTLPVFDIASAAVLSTIQNDVAILISGVDGNPAPALGDLCRILAAGLYTGVPYVGPAPTVGDPVYVSDAGDLSLTSGTYPRIVGNVVKDNGTTFDVWFDSSADVTSVLGPAGGVLGYAGSYYPNPNGLAPVVGDVIPLKAGTTDTEFRVDARAAGLGLSGANGTLRGGGGSDASPTVAGGAGGSAAIFGADGGAADPAQVGGAGGNAGALAGNGADGGAGGNSILEAGAGGVATAAYAAGNGGAASVTGGAGGPASTAHASGAGGDSTSTAGVGGTAAGAQVGGAGGWHIGQGGSGGNGSALADPGAGGKAQLLAGNAGATGKSAGGAAGGAVEVKGGAGTGDGAGGLATIQAGAAGSSGGAGGSVTVIARSGGSGTALVSGGAGGSWSAVAGNGGNASTAQGAGAAGTVGLTAGKGGRGNTGGAATAGATATLSAGAGGDGLGAVAAAAGGAAYLNAGNAGTPSTGAGAQGGAAYVNGGDGTNASAGGSVAMTGGSGDATGAGIGGGAIVIGGLGTGGAAGGNVLIEGGPTVGGGTAGTVLVGTITANAVGIGRSGKDVACNGRNVGTPTTYAPLAATTIPVNGPTIFLNPAANRDMTASPTLQTSGITAGTIVTLVNEDTTFYVDLTQDAGGTSYLKLATGNIFLFKYDTITLIFDGTYWVEVGRNVQPGKSYTPVAGTTIPVLCPVVLLANAGNVDLGTANATIQTTGINAGTRVTFVQKGAGTTTFRRGGSTLLRLTNPNHAVAQYGTLELVYDGANWCEVALAANA
jgi:hypothetical protein